MRRPLLLVTTALTLAACSGGGGADTPVGSAAATGTPVVDDPSTPPAGSPGPQQVTELSGGVRRFGDGRALFASFDPAADRTIVATTTGVVTQVGDGEPVPISHEMATRFATSDDGRLAAAITSAGHLTIWEVTSGGRGASFDATADDGTELSFAGGV
jgi:hypothetical protein